MMAQFEAHYNRRFKSTRRVMTEFKGIHVLRDRPRRKIFLSQQKKIDELLDTFGPGVIERQQLHPSHDPMSLPLPVSKWFPLRPVNLPIDPNAPPLILLIVWMSLMQLLFIACVKFSEFVSG